jgi:hypothetical protein
MKHLLIIVILLISRIALSQSDDKLGIGVIRLLYPSNALVFYKDTLTRIVEKKIPFSKSESNYKTLELNSWFSPIQSIAFDEWENIIDFDIICIENNNKWYHVLIDSDKDENYWLQWDSSMTFTLWSDLLKNMLCITRKDSTEKIYKTNDLKADTIVFKKYECFRAIEINGYWMKIGYYKDSTDKYEGNSIYIGGDLIELGWIIWRDDNSILINYYDN